jgi:hypothetical protein
MFIALSAYAGIQNSSEIAEQPGLSIVPHAIIGYELRCFGNEASSLSLKGYL